MKILLILLIFVTSGFAAEPWESDYSSLLGKYVSKKGVRYAAWKENPTDLQTLLKITDSIAATNPEKLSRDEQLAFYINAYNAWTLQNVLQAYPIESIRDVYPLFGFFTRKTITVANQKMSLNALEKSIIIAKFKEPRIHAAINCASESCPPLANESFTAAKLDSQLNQVFGDFVNGNPQGVQISKDGKSIVLSSIFKWYADDFKPAGGAVPYINQFRKKKLPIDAKVTFQDYDWNLNESK